ncbi:STAS domain-containing protein [Planomonospora parontospora]|uniref:STAS domain-containing protein n=1 Tax=Planomonospora parontospora TaxID=58119 RepID=UPI001670BCB8|nr:STAS domain-containing protein [Planomonospora parontospora]GGL59605.1 hypothetical protein GCM10014719_71190 [Planomonospora parontospora subsp. antibiotica]GII20340.1 hypothetical protein Ppa05_70660 [Planomonospora parontospora subsp. antibiotica]
MTILYGPASAVPATGVPEPGTASCDAVDALLYADRQLRLVYRPAPSAARIRLIGEIDATNRNALEQTLARAGHGGEPLLIDAGRLRFIDTGGTLLLARLCQAGAARVVNVPPFLRRLADLLDLPLGIDAVVSAAAHDHRSRQG